MRPLAVLLLVLAAIAALALAFASLGGRGREAPPVVPTQVQEEPEPDAGPARPVRTAAEPTPERSAVAQAPEEPAEEARASGWIRGEVTTLAGVPIDDAQVGLYLDSEGRFELAESLQSFESAQLPDPVKRTVTLPDGRFEFPNVRPGNHWFLVVHHASYPRTAAGPITVPEKGGAQERIILRSGLAMYGTVLDADTGLPVPGATLELSNPMSEVMAKRRGGAVEMERAVADELGRFEFLKIGSGQRTLEIRAEGYATSYQPNFAETLRAKNIEARRPVGRRTNYGQQLQELAERPNEPLQVDFELQRERTIRGRVVAPDGGSPEGVVVNAIQMQTGQGSRSKATTGPDGSFEVGQLADGEYTLWVQVKGYEVTKKHRVEAGEVDVELVLVPLGGVEGRVVDGETGRPVSRFTAIVRYVHPDNIAWGSEHGRRRFNDASDGSFRVDGVLPGPHVVEVKAKGYASSFSAPFEVVQGEIARGVVVRLSKGGTLRGRVLDATTREPIVGATVRTEENNWFDSEIMRVLEELDSSATSRLSTKTDAKGEWQIDKITPSLYQVRVELDGFAPVTMNDVPATDGGVTEVEEILLLRGATISGLVMGAFEDPVPGANVVLRAAAEDSFETYTARTDGTGAYLLRNIPAGVYVLAAYRPPSPNASPFTQMKEQQHSEIEVTIASGGRYDHPLSLPAVSQ